MVTNPGAMEGSQDGLLLCSESSTRISGACVCVCVCVVAITTDNDVNKGCGELSNIHDILLESWKRNLEPFLDCGYAKVRELPGCS